MHRLEHRVFVAEIRSRRQPQPADNARQKIGNDIAVEIRQQQAIERLRLHHQLHAQRVYHPAVGRDGGIIGKHLLCRLQEQAVGEFEHVGLVPYRDALASQTQHVIGREPRHALGGAARNDFEGFRRIIVDHALKAEIQILAVLAEQHDVHAAIARGDARIGFYRAHIGEQFQFLAQRDRDTRIDPGVRAFDLAFHAIGYAERRGGRPFERDARPRYRVEHTLGQRGAGFLAHFHARRAHIPLNPHS